MDKLKIQALQFQIDQMREVSSEDRMSKDEERKAKDEEIKLFLVLNADDESPSPYARDVSRKMFDTWMLKEKVFIVKDETGTYAPVWKYHSW